MAKLEKLSTAVVESFESQDHCVLLYATCKQMYDQINTLLSNLEHYHEV